MSVERVTAGVKLDVGDRFIILYGGNTSDTFCTQELLLRDIEWVLHRYLKSQGYQRILFYDGHQKLYFLDAESRERFLPASCNAPLPISDNEMKVTPGPLGRKKGLLEKHSATTSPTPVASPATATLQAFSSMHDIVTIPYFQAAMVETKQLSAIIFSNAEDLKDFANRRELFGRIVEWSRLPPSNHNRCIFVFHSENRNDLQAFCHNHGFTYLENLLLNREQVGQSFNICGLGAPIADEIEYLIHYFRLEKGKPVDWGTFQLLSRWLAAENRSLNYWYDCFDVAEEISLAEARKRKWLSGNVSTEPALKRLQELIGLHAVKELVQQRIEQLEVQKKRCQQGLITDPPRLHMVFKGNPGTGKTTVARLIGEIYRDLGLLQRGQVVEVSRKDLVAGFVGQTALKTDSVVDKALDGVLFIDEAYTLNQPEGRDFGQEAIETLLKRMEDESHRLAVIVAGYPNQMDEFINSNPGLKRRFATEVIFEDYTPDELMAIFRQRISQVQGSISTPLEPALENLFIQLYEERDDKFGNAGTVENLFNAIDNRRSQRVAHQKLDPVHEPYQFEDLPPKEQEKSQQGVKNEEILQQALQELDSMIGLQEVKRIIRQLVNVEKADQLLKAAGYHPGDTVETRHMIFLGNPGTGKTTVARLVGKIFKALGLLKKGKLKEVKRNDLVAGYIGQTEPKTQKVIESALDSILFIDEAYSLARSSESDFGRDAINTLVPAMENERHRLVVILAGYSREMMEFLAANSGLESRIPYRIEFPDYDGTELFEIFMGMCRQYKRICPDNVENRLREVFNKMYSNRGLNFGNGRDVRTFYEAMVNRQKERIYRDNVKEYEAMITFTLSDIPSFS
jgi:SpoVK/Ycf46/Vps4 family AAA+-type ATPase